MDKKIEIHYLTDDNIVKSLCAKYWDTNGTSLKYNTQNLIKEFKKYYPKLDSLKLNQIATENSIAYFEGTELCNRCKLPYQRLIQRYPLWDGRNHNGKVLDGIKYCDKCYEVTLAEKQQEWQQEQEKIKFQKEELMKDAFIKKVYEQLDLSDYKLLFHLAHSDNLHIACSKGKFNQADIQPIIEKLNNLHLINWNNGINGYNILQELISIADKIVSEDKIAQMRVAIQIKKSSLTKFERKFFASFAEASKKYDDYNKRITVAKTQWGLSLDRAEKFYRKLVSLNLVNDNIETLPSILPEAIEDNLAEKTKSIWENTPIEKDIYKSLIKKVKNLYVFPQVPYSAFTDRKKIEHLFIEFKNLISNPANYYLQCRTDFLLCDKQGVPKAVIEYQGGGHQEEDKKFKDEFKQRILQENGIILNLVDKYNKDEVLENPRLLTKPKTLTDGEIDREIRKDNRIREQKINAIVQEKEKERKQIEDEKKRTVIIFEKSGIKIMWNHNSRTYITDGTRVVPVPYYRHHKSLTEEECIELLNVQEEELHEFLEMKKVIKEFKEKNIQIIWYFNKPTIIDDEIKVLVPKDTNPNDLTVDQCVDLLNEKRQKKKESV